MARHELHHRLQFLDGVVRISETSSNDVTRVISEIDIREATNAAGETITDVLEKMQMPDEQRMMLQVMLSAPDALLHYGCDFTIKGWFNFPDPPDDFLEAPDPDPSGGIQLKTAEMQETVMVGGHRVSVGLKQTVPAR